ncbi:DJ-1/PfpI family protein [Saccharopolyspora sp. NPDC002376]
MNRRSLLRAGAAVAAAGAATTTSAHAEPLRRKPFRVHLLVFDGADDLDFIAPNEVFQHAAHAGLPIDAELVTGAEPGIVTSAFGTRFEAGGWAPHEADVIVVAGGGYGLPEGGVPGEIERGHLPAALRDARRPGLVLASVCTGAMLLSAAGITRGRPCTTHHMAQQDLAREGGQIMPGRVVDDGDLVTAGGITSGLDLALWLVERGFGAQAALKVETVMEYERRGTVWRR